jgi:hypothetical protein
MQYLVVALFLSISAGGLCKRQQNCKFRGNIDMITKGGFRNVYKPPPPPVHGGNLRRP